MLIVVDSAACETNSIMKTSEFFNLVADKFKFTAERAEVYPITGYTLTDCYVMFHFLEFLIAI